MHPNDPMQCADPMEGVELRLPTHRRADPSKGRIEELKKPTEDEQITFRFANLKRLPRDYVGEKHTVLVKGWPYQEGTGGECELEERPGPGPDLDFGFNGRTILFTYFSFPGEEECP